MPERLKAAGYIRVSTEEQTEGHSLDAQRHEIERYCNQHGYQLVRVFGDEGVSAHTERIDKRPQLAALLEAAMLRDFDVVIVHTIDRWARNVGVQRQALQCLGEAKVGFVSITENFDFSTPGGKLMLTMIGGVSEFFSDQLGVHVSKGQHERAESGLQVGPIPFGYITRGRSEAPILDPDEGRALLIVFERSANGASNGELADWLSAEGFKPRGRNAVFTPFAVKDMLKNRFYLGFVTYRGEEWLGRHKAVVTSDLFERVQAKRTAARPRRTAFGRSGLLQGRLRCGHCGSNLHSERNHLGNPLYRERHGLQCHTNGRSLSAEWIDPQVAEIWRAVELEPDWRARIAELAAKDYSGPDLAALTDKRRRIARAYGDGAYGDAEYAVLLREIDQQVQSAAVVQGPSYEEAASLLENMTAFWEEATGDERKRLLDPLIEHVYIDIDTKLIGAITPTPAFRDLIEHGLQRTASSKAVLLTEGEARQIMSGYGLVETGEN